MNERNEKYRTKITEACQPHVDQPIRAVGLFQPYGSTSAAAARLVASGPLGSRIEGNAVQEAPGIPRLGLYALTDSALHVMEGTPKGFNWRITSNIGSWPLSMFTARSIDVKGTDQIELVFSGGATIRLESMRMGSLGFNEDIISHLLERSTAAS
jgi:hypothetical protein